MRLLILSNLHREAWGETPIGVNLSVSRPDVVILAGDIDADAASVAWAERTLPSIPTLYVRRNPRAFEYASTTPRDRSPRLARPSSAIEYLQGREVVIAGVQFLGCTLWADVALCGENRETKRWRHP